MKQMQIAFDSGVTFMANINVISFSKFKLCKSLWSTINTYPTHLSTNLFPEIKMRAMITGQHRVEFIQFPRSRETVSPQTELQKSAKSSY